MFNKLPTLYYSRYFIKSTKELVFLFDIDMYKIWLIILTILNQLCIWVKSLKLIFLFPSLFINTTRHKKMPPINFLIRERLAVTRVPEGFNPESAIFTTFSFHRSTKAKYHSEAIIQVAVKYTDIYLKFNATSGSPLHRRRSFIHLYSGVRIPPLCCNLQFSNDIFIDSFKNSKISQIPRKVDT